METVSNTAAPLLLALGAGDGPPSATGLSAIGPLTLAGAGGDKISTVGTSVGEAVVGEEAAGAVAVGVADAGEEVAGVGAVEAAGVSALGVAAGEAAPAVDGAGAGESAENTAATAAKIRARAINLLAIFVI